MGEFVLVKKGTFRNKPVDGTVFKLVQDSHPKPGGKLAIRVDGKFTKRFPNSEFTIFIPNHDAYERISPPTTSVTLTVEEMRDSLQERFEFLVY
ncbi:MAG: hypothetical protein HC836_40895 [Richelia sp. RM2_1_2]|nr:hypothetical protein [Richelia sp. RM2_1_2]